jgi:hypothetical protein
MSESKQLEIQILNYIKLYQTISNSPKATNTFEIPWMTLLFEVFHGGCPAEIPAARQPGPR